MKAVLALGAIFSATPVATADRSLSGIFSPPASAVQRPEAAVKPAEPLPPAAAAASFAEKSSLEKERAATEEAAPYVPKDKYNLDFLDEEPEFLADEKEMMQLRNLMKTTKIGDPFYGLHSRSVSSSSNGDSSPKMPSGDSSPKSPSGDSSTKTRSSYNTHSNHKHRDDIEEEHAEGTAAKSGDKQNAWRQDRSDVTASKEEISFMNTEEEASNPSFTADDEGVAAASLVEKASVEKERASTEEAAPYIPKNKSSVRFLGEEPEFLADENEVNEHKIRMKGTAMEDPFYGLHSRSSSQSSKGDSAPKARSFPRRPLVDNNGDGDEGGNDVDRHLYNTNSMNHREDLVAMAEEIKEQHAEVVDEIRQVLDGTTSKSNDNENESSEGRSASVPPDED